MIPSTKYLRALFFGAFLSVGLVTTTLIPHSAMAQADMGSVSGVVTDATGAVVAKASVTVTNIATGAVRTSVTGAKGEYSITQLLPAVYNVNITAAGFAAATDQVVVTVGSTNSVNVKLAVAGGKTEVIVQADDFAGVQLEKPEVSAVLETQQILSLPTLDRNPYNLVAFSGNLSADSGDMQHRGVGFNIAGSRSTSVDILLDGTENTDLYAVGIGQTVPMDATSEIRIVTSNSGAEYGRGSGAVNVSTKSGTNSLHGSAYEFNRISTLASDGYNNNYIHAMTPSVPAKPRYVHNQFGYSVGGPVKKDKLFFFSSTEWTRIRSMQNIISVVPTQDFINLSAQNMKDFFGAYGTLAKGREINGSKFTGASDAVQSVFGGDITDIAMTQLGLTPDAKNPIADCTDPRIAKAPICTTELFGQSIYQAPEDSGGGAPIDQWITFNRGDWTINQTTSMFVRYIQQSAINPVGYMNNSPYAGYDTDQTQINHNLEISISKAITPALASATKILGSRNNQTQPLGGKPVSPTLYINSQAPVTLGGGLINLPGYAATTPGNSIPFGGPQNFIQIGEDLAWTKGKNQFSIGGNFLYIKDNRTYGAYENAVDALVQTGDSGALDNFFAGNIGYLNVAVDPKGAYPCYRDPNTGAYIQTSACAVQLPIGSPNFSRSNRYDDGAAYFSDSYKFSPRLTLNLGLRWEVYGPQHSQKASNDANFFLGAGNTPWDQIRNGQVKTRETAPDGRLWNLNKNQFAPKIGFAYDPFGDGKTSIRGGFGISFERNFNNVTFNVIQNPPNQGIVAFTSADNNNESIPITVSNFSSFGDPKATGTWYLPSVTLRAVDPKIKPAYASNWSLSVEHEYKGLTASLSYVGTRGIHNYSIANINRTFDGGIYEGDARVQNRTNLQYGSINWRGADGDSYYHGFTTEVRSANLGNTGLNIRFDYTWSHSIDNDSSAFNDSQNESGMMLGYTDPWKKDFDRGTSDFDVRHRIASALVWELPFAKHMTGNAKSLLDNWTLSTTLSAQTGNPFTVFDGGYAVNVYPRATFVKAPSRRGTGGMKDLSAGMSSPNTFSYIHLPDYIPGTNYRETLNPSVNNYYDNAHKLPLGTPYAGSDIPICTGIHGAGCAFDAGMDGRNVFVGPGNWNDNFGIVKDIKIRERYDLQIKGEFINLLNHANTILTLNGTNDVESYTDVLAYKGGIAGSSSLPTNRNTELSIHFSF